MSVWAVVLQHGDTVGRLRGITAQEFGLWGWSLDPGKHQARSVLAAFSLLHGPHHGFALSTQNLSPDKIFHVIVAPCYDKKLEALQEDVPMASRSSRGTDCVLTSGEGGPRERPLGGRPVHWLLCVQDEGLTATPTLETQRSFLLQGKAEGARVPRDIAGVLMFLLCL